MENTTNSCYAYNGIQVAGGALNSVKKPCGTARHNDSPSYIFPNPLKPLCKSLRQKEITGRPDTVSSISTNTMAPNQSPEILSTSASDSTIDSAPGIVSELQNLSIVEKRSPEQEDDYEVHEDEFVTPDDIEASNNPDDSINTDKSDSLEEQELEAAFGYHVDLATQEIQHERRPIYTRALLECVKRWADQIRGEFSLSLEQRSLHHIDADGLNKNPYRVWNWNGDLDADFLRVEYLSRAEMHPDFQSRYGEHSDQIEALRRYNKDHSQDCIDAPYTFITFERYFSNEHRNQAKMAEYWKAIMHTKDLWIASSARRQLQETFLEIAKTCAPITQVVCFGLGALNLNKMFYNSAIQYMAVFSIIQTLNEYYRKTHPDRPLIKLVLQDPNYEQRDYEILQKLFNNISFVSDPDGLLAINANTLVVMAFLPVQVPLVQIIADLFSENPAQGPAAILCDIMEVDVEKWEYSFSDRASLATARHLMNHYEKKGDEFGYHGLEEDFMEDLYGEDWRERKRLYWLNYMDLWVRKIGTNQERPS